MSVGSESEAEEVMAPLSALELVVVLVDVVYVIEVPEEDDSELEAGGLALVNARDVCSRPLAVLEAAEAGTVLIRWLPLSLSGPFGVGVMAAGVLPGLLLGPL